MPDLDDHEGRIRKLEESDHGLVGEFHEFRMQVTRIGETLAAMLTEFQGDHRTPGLRVRIDRIERTLSVQSRLTWLLIGGVVMLFGRLVFTWFTQGG